MTNLTDLIGDTQAVGSMDDTEFRAYWEALGVVVRLACQARKADPAPAAEQKTEINNTNCSTERTWSPHRRAPAAAFGFAKP